MAATSRHTLTFPGSMGAMLAGRLDLPQGPPAAYALFAHCFTCTKDVLAASRVSAALAARGFAVLRFDFTGLGESGGDFADTGFSSNVADLVAAAAFLREHYAAPSLLVGHSFGGAAVLAAVGKVPEARAVATIAAPADPEHIRHLIATAIPEIEANGEAVVRIAGRDLKFRRQFLDDIGAADLTRTIAGMRQALLVLHSPLDDTVGVENAAKIFAAAKHPKSFVSLDGADHLLSRAADAEYAAHVLSAWAARYIGAPQAGAAPEAESDTVVVRENGIGPFGQTITTGRHVWLADEPPETGGANSGPTPHDLLLASLGGCIAITLRMYADRKEWMLARTTVRLRQDRIDRDTVQIWCEVDVDGDLDEAQRQRLLEIAERCPIHRAMRGDIRIETTARADPGPPPSA